MPDNARVLAEAGYVVLTFDYKGWGDSDGAKTRLAPYSRVTDVQAALTFMGAQPEVHAARLGIYGTSYGGATVVFVAAIDPRVKCVVSVVGIGKYRGWTKPTILAINDEGEDRGGPGCSSGSICR